MFNVEKKKGTKKATAPGFQIWKCFSNSFYKRFDEGWQEIHCSEIVL